MPENDVTPVAAASTAPAGETQTATQTPAAAASAEPTVSPEAKPNLWDDPAAAKAEIERLRKENGAARTTAKANAADEARNELAQTIGKALGLVEDESIDPVQLTTQLTESQALARQAKVELAVFRAATDTDADPAALLDSRTFLAKLADLDPTDSAAVTAAISEAVAVNPRLGKASPQQQGMKPNPAQGRSASPPLGVAEQIAAAQQGGDLKAVLRLKSAQALQNSPN